MSLVSYLLLCSSFTLHFVKSDPELIHLNFTQIANKYGYNVEEFDVVTEDKYILKLFHIKGNPTKTVMLGHGILDCADTFIIRGEKSLTLTLARRGYDVWVINYRGTKYSRLHETLNPDKDKEFWNYSFHEMGSLDLPANIDFILEKTNQTQVIYIGHSQGTQTMFVLGSEKPEFNHKVKLFIAMAPTAALSHLPYPTNMLLKTGPPLNAFLQATGQEEIFNNDSFLIKTVRALCSAKDVGYEICGKDGLFAFAGSDPAQVEPDFLPILFGHYPISTSRKNLDHLNQCGMKKKMIKYDYGLGNLQKYGSVVPPKYEIQKITTATALLVGRNDKFADPESVLYIRDRIQNFYYHEMEYDKFNHLDFVWGNAMDNHLFPVVFELLDNYTQVFIDNETLGCN